MSWNHTVTFICPIAQQLNAKRISRSLDPDVGGFDAFETYLSADGNAPATHVVYSSPCEEVFLAKLNAVASDPNVLKLAVDADYAARWSDETAPTLQECADFLSTLQIYIDMDMQSAIIENNLMVLQNGPV